MALGDYTQQQDKANEVAASSTGEIVHLTRSLVIAQHETNRWLERIAIVVEARVPSPRKVRVPAPRPADHSIRLD